MEISIDAVNAFSRLLHSTLFLGHCSGRPVAQQVSPSGRGQNYWHGGAEVGTDCIRTVGDITGQTCLLSVDPHHLQHDVSARRNAEIT